MAWTGKSGWPESGAPTCHRRRANECNRSEAYARPPRNCGEPDTQNTITVADTHIIESLYAFRETSTPAMSNSPESLQELPQPFDISTAVSLALRFNSPCSTVGSLSDFHHHQINCTVNRSSDEWYGHPTKSAQALSTEMILPPSSYVGSMEGMHYQMQLDAWSDSTTLSTDDIFETEAEQLDSFCKYLDSTGDEDISEVLIPSPPPHDQQHDYLRQQAVHFRHNQQQQALHKKKKRLSSSAHYAGGSVHYTAGCTDDPLEKLHGIQPLRLLEPEPVVKCLWKVELANWDLWQAFDQIGTEMVITKNGRRMFPSLSYSLSKLQPENSYSIKLNILPVDSRRYKFLQTEWVPVGRADKKSVYKEYVHPDSPNAGSFWMEKPITFKLVKLTNNKSTTYSDQMILNSMQKYQPVLRVTCETDGMTQNFRFPETTFIAVTAYQNHSITQLKIENNPYARAFRESIPSDGNAPERKGGHCKRNETQQKQQGQATPSKIPLSPTQMPAEAIPNPSTTSREQGSNGSDNSPITTLLQSEADIIKDAEYDCHLNFWTDDDDSIYNPTLLTPPMLASSFSDTYLPQSSNVDLETAVSMDSPLGEHLNASFIVDVESVDDDVFELS